MHRVACLLLLFTVVARAQVTDPPERDDFWPRAELVTSGVYGGMLLGLDACVALGCLKTGGTVEAFEGALTLGAIVGGVAGWYATNALTPEGAHAVASGVTWGLLYSTTALAAGPTLRTLTPPEIISVAGFQVFGLAAGLLAVEAFEPDDSAIALVNSTMFWTTIVGAALLPKSGLKATAAAPVLLGAGLVGLVGGALWSRVFKPTWPQTWLLDLGAMVGISVMASAVSGAKLGSGAAAGAIIVGMGGGGAAAWFLMRPDVAGAKPAASALPAILPTPDGRLTFGFAGVL